MSLAVINTREYLTCNEAAEELDLSPDSIRKYCNNAREGKSPSLDALQVGRDWLIHRNEINRYKRERVGRGRPAKE